MELIRRRMDEEDDEEEGEGEGEEEGRRERGGGCNIEIYILTLAHYG